MSLFICGCGNKVKETALHTPSAVIDTLQYTRFNDTEKADWYDLYYDYILFKENDKSVANLNSIIKNLVFDKCNSMKECFGKNLKEYKEWAKGAEEKYPWTDLVEMHLVLNTSNVISFVFGNFQSRVGGAIAFGNDIGYTYELETGTIIKFEDIVYMKKLSEYKKIVEQCFRESLSNEERNMTLQELGWANNIIKFNKNYYLCEKGMVISYGRFEAQDSPQGREILIPYKKLETVLKDNSIIKKYSMWNLCPQESYPQVKNKVEKKVAKKK